MPETDLSCSGRCRLIATARHDDSKESRHGTEIVVVACVLARGSTSAVEKTHQVRYVLAQSNLTSACKLIPSHGSPAAVGFVDRQVAGVLQLAQMGSEAAILLFKYPLQAAERHGIVLGEQDADRQPNPVVKQAV